MLRSSGNKLIPTFDATCFSQTPQGQVRRSFLPSLNILVESEGNASQLSGLLLSQVGFDSTLGKLLSESAQFIHFCNLPKKAACKYALSERKTGLEREGLLMNFYLTKNGQTLGPYSAEQIQIFLKQRLATTDDMVWADGWPSLMSIRSETGEQLVVLAGQRRRQSFQGKQGGTFLPGFDHLNIPLRYVRLFCECILTQLRAITEAMEIPSKSFERAFRYLVLHTRMMPNQGFA